jgi:hypothetical protein
MDNLSARKNAAVEAVLTQAGLNLLYLPRYSPDFSPIEPSWSKLKAKLRTVAAQTAEALETALGPAIDSITPADARGWFNFCGYPLSSRSGKRSNPAAVLHYPSRSPQSPRACA